MRKELARWRVRKRVLQAEWMAYVKLPRQRKAELVQRNKESHLARMCHLIRLGHQKRLYSMVWAKVIF